MRMNWAICIALIVLVAGLLARTSLKREPPRIVEAPAPKPDDHAERVTVEEFHGDRKVQVTHIRNNGEWIRETPLEGPPPPRNTGTLPLSDHRFLLMLAGLALLLIAWLGMLLAALCEGILWGVAYFLFTPIVALIFSICHWDKARVWILLYVSGSALVIWASALMTPRG